MELQMKKKADISTKHLILASLSEDDMDMLVDILTNEAVTNTYMVPEFASLEQAIALAKKLISYSQPEDTKHFLYGIYRDQKLIGFVNDCGQKDGVVEIGYALHPNVWGRGYMTEAFGRVLEELKDLGFQKVVAGYFEGNVASARVLEKCHMVKSDCVDEIEYRGVKHTCYYYERQLR